MLYDIYSQDGTRKLNSQPIEAQDKDELKNIIELGLFLDFDCVTLKEIKPIRATDITFEKTASSFFRVGLQGVYMYSGFVEKQKVITIDEHGIWDYSNKISLEKFQTLPNWDLIF